MSDARPQCPHHRRPMQYNSRKGHYCWSCDNRARQLACEHRFTNQRWQGIVGYRWYCVRCGEQYVGPTDEYGAPDYSDVMPDTPWKPNWSLPPGEILTDLMEERGITPLAMCAATGMTPGELEGLATGAERVTQTRAAALAAATGVTATFWLNLQSAYDAQKGTRSP